MHLYCEIYWIPILSVRIDGCFGFMLAITNEISYGMRGFMPFDIYFIRYTYVWMHNVAKNNTYLLIKYVVCFIVASFQKLFVKILGILIKTIAFVSHFWFCKPCRVFWINKQLVDWNFGRGLLSKFVLILARKQFIITGDVCGFWQQSCYNVEYIKNNELRAMWA